MLAVEDEISGMINYALAHEQGTAMTRARKCARKYITSNIIPKFGTPPLAARRYAYQLLRLCLARGTGLVKKILALKMLPNGDWRNQTGIEIYFPHDTIMANVNLEEIGEVVADGTHTLQTSSTELT